MTELSRSEDKRLVLATGRAHPELAQEIAEELGTELLPMSAYDFANGEIYVRSGESVRGKDVFIIQSHPAPLNNHLMEQLIMVDSMKRASARRITVVSPFYPYARQDKKGRGREPISARLVADLYKTAGASRVMSVDLHTAQIQGFFDGPVDHLFAIPLLADHIRSSVEGEEVTVVSPDTGRVRVAEQWADRLGGVPLGFVHKSRDLTVPNKAESKTVVGDVEGRVCVLIDDMIDTGGTIAGAVQILKDAGAKDVIIAATHAVFSDPAAQRLGECGAREVVVTNTLPIPEEKRFETLTVLSIAPLIARAIREVFASLYNDRAIAYRVHHDFEHAAVALSAGVQKMVRSDIGSSGVMFTVDNVDDTVARLRTVGGIEERIESTLPPVRRPKIVPRS